MRNFFSNLFKSKKSDPEAWNIDKSTIKGKYQDLKYRFMQDHGNTFQVHFNETGSGINIVLFLKECTAIELKQFLKIIADNSLKLSNVIYIQDSSGLNITLVCTK